MCYRPFIFIFISKCETSDIFLSLNLDPFSQFDKRHFFAITFRESSAMYILHFFSSVQSLLVPNNHGWSQEGASLQDKLSLSFHQCSPTVSDQRVLVNLISILIKVEILRAQWNRYVAVHRKTGSMITVEPLIVWLYFKQYDISHTWRAMWHTNDKFETRCERRAWDMTRWDTGRSDTDTENNSIARSSMVKSKVYI